MIQFTKMEGLGNDYVYIDCTKKSEQEIKQITSLASFISDRHFGVGSDGLILICTSNVADFKMSMFNSDGSEAEMCGNGIRCVGKFVYDKKVTDKTSLSIETLAGIKYLTLNVEKEKVKTVRVDMGEPILEPNQIPVIADQNPVTQLPLKVFDKEFIVSCVSMGNPHAICEIEKLEDFPIETYGPILEKDEHFPKKSNIEWIEIVNRQKVKMRVWERGAGETLACGTGACAAAVACILQGKTDRKITVELLGGKLEIEWDEQTNHVFMTGPAKIVFEGVINEK